MSDDRTDASDQEPQYSAPLHRFRLIARIFVGAFALFIVAIFAIGLGHIALDIWKETSRSIARTDWSWWTWPRVLSAFLALVGITTLVWNRIRKAKRRSDR
jgi:uncharacterized BrkB/YihY/UPF0761 family membrane protein